MFRVSLWLIESVDQLDEIPEVKVSTNEQTLNLFTFYLNFAAQY